MRALRIASVVSLVGLVLMPGCKGKPAKGAGQTVEGRPVETQPPNANNQKPAFAGQTRAPYRTENVAFTTEVVASGLEHPWSLAFLPDGAMLVTEKPGRLRIVSPEGALSPPLAGLPEIDARGQGGLLDIAVDPRFGDTRRVYFCFAKREGDKNG